MSRFKSSILLETEDKDKKSVFAVANCILDYTKCVTNLKLQKLIFLTYGLHLSLYEERLYNSSIEAWKLGPVVRDIYNEFKNHGRDEITTRATILIDDNEFLVPSIAEEYKKEKLSVIAVCLYYENYSAPDLVNITHRMRSWEKAYNSAEQEKIIRDEDIFDDFNKIKSGIVDFINKY
jgi:uncharacterized phage-associated protein